MKNKSLFMTIAILVIAFSSIAQETGTFTDSRDGRTYKTVVIGTQTWMAENLAYKAGSGCWAYNNDINYVAIYGYLYNWETAKNVCPKGWHLPSWAEFNALVGFSGGRSVAGGKLKSETGWNSPNGGVTNSTGFTALPGGNMQITTTKSIGGASIGDHFYDKGTSARGWLSNEGWDWYMICESTNVLMDTEDKTNGISVRCLKD